MFLTASIRGSLRQASRSMAWLGAVCLFQTAAIFAAEPDNRMNLDRWEFYQDCPLTDELETVPYGDFILPSSIFDQARLDLGDLRLCDRVGVEVPYALCVRRADFRDDSFQAHEFNRSTLDDKSVELGLDLGENSQQHNQVDVSMPGVDFRRHAELEGSDDRQQWRKLVEGNLVHFKSSKAEFDEHQLRYPDSRFRYLRLRVYPDSAVDKQAVEVEQVSVHRRVEVPGEFVTLPAKVGPREPVRTANEPGSAWILHLGGDRVPCQRIDVQVKDEDFARSYQLQAEGRSDQARALPEDGAYRDAYVPAVGSRDASTDYEAGGAFNTVTSGLWQRLADEKKKPLVAEFAEVRASRLRLLVTDNRNPPLDIESVTFTAPARQIVFARTPQLEGPLRLYYGNPRATAPHYDLERNLPAELNPRPARLQLGPRESNPSYVPEPKPLTERYPWLIYAVLGAASAVLAVILVNLGRTAVAQHDAAIAKS